MPRKLDQRLKTAALAGTALAAGIGSTAVAEQLLTGADVKDGSVKLKDLARSVRAQLDESGPRGESGPQGLPGAPGPAGQAGAQGPVGVGSQLLGGRAIASVTSGSPRFTAVIGGNSNFQLEPNVQIAAPPGAVSVTDLRIRQPPQTAVSSATLTFTLRVNGVDSAVSCSLVVTAAAPSCNSGGAVASVSPSDLLSLGIVSAGSKVVANAAFSLDLNFGG